ncbi:hypothetical protein BW731_09550 [Vagococcus martis]|uniref:Uncharacterized protein n=1 Tax=Vagococcus martis TaxID=1768210 RepID=A0A1V4DJ20_9ENTE|nr:hypothetical protein [Vagococcus martis]OPF88402.1 hypothetical protein BW731_09550 [Vagococcus martis]
MNKSIVDSIITMVIIVSMIIYSSVSNSVSILSMSMPIILLLLILVCSLFKKINLKFVFSIIFVMLFSIFATDPGMVDISSYVLVGILSLPLALLGTYAVKYIREDKMKKVTVIDVFHKRFPSMSLSIAFIINVVLSSIFLIGIVTFVGQSFNIVLSLLMILWSILASLSDSYFLNKT